MSNPFHAPHPYPISAEVRDDGLSVDHFLEPQRLNRLLDENAEWLCHGEHSTREIYTVLFRFIDPSMEREREGMANISEVMWDLGYRPMGRSMSSSNLVWKWAATS